VVLGQILELDADSRRKETKGKKKERPVFGEWEIPPFGGSHGSNQEHWAYGVFVILGYCHGVAKRDGHFHSLARSFDRHKLAGKHWVRNIDIFTEITLVDTGNVHLYCDLSVNRIHS
jgi:hypothetical protein